MGKLGGITTLLALVLALAGCTGAVVDPEAVVVTPSVSPVFIYPNGQATPDPVPVVSPAPAGPATVAPVQLDLECLPPTPGVMKWLHHTGSADLPESGVAMVYAGPGDTPGEDWWVVAAVSFSDSGGSMQRFDVSYLTNSPDDDLDQGERWIGVGGQGRPMPGIIRQSVNWDGVSWRGARLDQGLAAQAKAYSCLPDQ
ncbi:MAG: hypothetical protein LBV30_02195 [Propionibacteriaceae bacterium]|nr:hypothetical protein [Propionibacteriaceae bacterium]